VAEPARFAYFDTSALVKRYVRERGSVAVRRLLRSHCVLSSALLGLEIRSVLHRRRREGALTGAALRRVERRVAADEAAWQQIAVGAEVLEEARDQLTRFAVRTLDAIHLATALVAHREGLEVPFVTADRRQAVAARAQRFEVLWIGKPPAPGA
jgi:uncharacterized protein